MLDYLGNYMSRTVNNLKLISKHASMVKTQVEQVLKAHDDLLRISRIKPKCNKI